MVDVTPSSTPDDLPGTALPSGAVPVDASVFSLASAPQVPAPHFLTRRELREAEARAAASAIPVSAVNEAPAVSAAPVYVAPVVVAPSSHPLPNHGPDFSIAGIQITAASIQDAPRARSTPSRGAASSRKPSRAEGRRVHAAAPKAPRKHPVSVLATMAVVGGLFAVAGLPAYALTNPEIDGARADDVGQSMIVSAQSAPASAVRDGYQATTAEQIAESTRDGVRAANNAKYLASGARELGDDYPWAYELGQEQGGGLSELNYYYRQCTDFVAWRLNRDAGSYAAPFKWVWSNLTPTGGDASQWKYAWQQHGWPVTNVPTVGSVAWFGWSNHVAYVKQVLAGGFIVVEEYNYVQSVYGQRTIPASSVEAFLGAPS